MRFDGGTLPFSLPIVGTGVHEWTGVDNKISKEISGNKISKSATASSFW